MLPTALEKHCSSASPMLNIPIERLKGYCFDGASNMSGRFSGVQARLKEVCTDSLYVHCANHSLDLVLQEVGREVSLVAETLNFVQGIATVIRESSKRKELYVSMFGCDDVVNILAICPTRWCVRTIAMKRVCSSYTQLQKTLKILKDDKSVRGDARAKIGGLYKQSLKGRTLFGLLCCEVLFEPCEAVAKNLQSNNASARGALECTHLLRERIVALRDDTVVQGIESKVSAADLKMPDARQHRASKTPPRYQPEAHAMSTWRQEFFEAVDLLTAELKRRFDQDGMKIAALRENVLIEAANSRGQQQTLELEGIFQDVEKLIKLCLCMPISVASSERSFSTLRRLKTWLRSNMTQKRLTHLTLMHVHSNILDNVDVSALMRVFISATPERKARVL
ncbi:hypothetical protein F7725_026354 [Dissostichus mawsoni]|uniref:HAT C-terminal dimerisation domain-containing protein n=1 Tax=Dissostichus mawsoni TaxID=36200 RepID=A0A7J5X7S0_DISMA|nr:hypothetical protein F7725_026354 [Dissostichus mawsoni]